MTTLHSDKVSQKVCYFNIILQSKFSHFCKFEFCPNIASIPQFLPYMPTWLRYRTTKQIDNKKTYEFCNSTPLLYFRLFDRPTQAMHHQYPACKNLRNPLWRKKLTAMYLIIGPDCRHYVCPPFVCKMGPCPVFLVFFLVILSSHLCVHRQNCGHVHLPFLAKWREIQNRVQN